MAVRKSITAQPPSSRAGEAWVPVSGARRGHYLWHLKPPTITYHGGSAYRVDGKFASPWQAQYGIAQSIEATAPQGFNQYDPYHQGLITYFEVNNSNLSMGDASAAYERAGDEVGDDPDADIVSKVEVAEGDWQDALRELWRWEVAQPETVWHQWANQAGTVCDEDARKLGACISYYVVAERMVSKERVFWGYTVRGRFTPFGREAYTEVIERIRKFQETGATIVPTVVGFFVALRVIA